MTAAHPAIGTWVTVLLHRRDRHGMVAVDDPLSVTIDDDSVAGHSGVNRFRGTATHDGASLSFGPLMSTRMAGEPAAMELEHAMLDALSTTAACRMVGDLRCLENADGVVVLVLRPATDDSPPSPPSATPQR